MICSLSHSLTWAPTWSGSLGHAVDDVDGQVEAVDLVVDRQLQRRVDVALLLVAADVQVVVVRAAVGQPVDQPGIAVEVEDDRLVVGEQRVEVAVASGRADVRCLAWSLKRSTTLMKRIFRSGKSFAQHGGGGQRLLRGNVAGAGHHHVRLVALRRCWPSPRCRCPWCSGRWRHSMSRYCRCGCLSATMTLT